MDHSPENSARSREKTLPSKHTLPAAGKPISYLVAVLLLATAVLLAWSSSFGITEFVFDETALILRNPMVQDPRPANWLPPEGTPSRHRPLALLSYSLDWALWGEKPFGYHLTNILLHIGVGLALFSLARRVMPRVFPGEASPRTTDAAALAAALVFLLHPVQTLVVTYLGQRCVAMAALFVLVSLSAAVRGWENPASRRAWHLFALACFAAGLGSKELIWLTPIFAVLYEWTFYRDSAARLLWRSRLLYGGYLGGILIQILFQYAGTPNHPSGEATELILSPSYLLVQGPVITHYLKTALWPAGLVLDWGPWFGPNGWAAVPYFLFVAALAAFCVALVLRRRPMGFVAVWFFVAIFPDSGILNHPDPLCFYRMYLPLAGLAMGFSILVFRAGRRFLPGRNSQAAVIMLLAAVILALGAATFQRNKMHHSARSIWADNVEKCPKNPRARYNLGRALLEEGRPAEAVEHLAAAAYLWDLEMHYADLAYALNLVGDGGRAKAVSEEALKKYPHSLAIKRNLGHAELLLGEPGKAAEVFAEVARREPDVAGNHANLGSALLLAGRHAEAVSAFERALALDPENPPALNGLGYALLLAGRPEEALPFLSEAVRRNPRDVPARLNLADALLSVGRDTDAAVHLRAVLSRDPGNREAARLLQGLGNKG
ncbi:MAG: tetratricopeptide repeat protein [Deltaproteobacteria bacterium]|nr:tetratricopeptide repeat protein [Deltaproteobacteria bacterium]